MISIMDRLFGRKPRTSSTIADRLDAARATFADAQGRVATAAERRRAAIESGDRVGAIAAKADSDAAEVDAEIAAEEVTALENALTAAQEADRAAARVAERSALVERRDALVSRFDREWSSAVETIADLLSEACAINRDRAEGGFKGEVTAAPDVDPDAPLIDAVVTISRRIGDVLQARPSIPKSPADIRYEENQARLARKRAEHEAEEALKREERAAEDQRNWEIEKSTGRNPGYKIPTEILKEGSARAPWWSER